MELKEKTLLTVLEKNQIEEEQLKIILYSLVCALKVLHQSNIVHRDIKPANILVDTKGVALCDFGLARTLPESCNGKHGGNTIKVRESELRKQSKETRWTREEEKKCIQMKLAKVQKHAQRSKKCLSPHVQTRWYRSPEVALLAQHYD